MKQNLGTNQQQTETMKSQAPGRRGLQQSLLARVATDWDAAVAGLFALALPGSFLLRESLVS